MKNILQEDYIPSASDMMKDMDEVMGEVASDDESVPQGAPSWHASSAELEDLSSPHPKTMERH
jgi:hypothetical protein